jgi:hypothetical protein
VGSNSRESNDRLLVFELRAVREFVGHGENVYDLSGSSNSFLLFGSHSREPPLKGIEFMHVSPDCGCCMQVLERAAAPERAMTGASSLSRGLSRSLLATAMTFLISRGAQITSSSPEAATRL